MRFLPGQSNDSPNTVDQKIWDDTSLLAYCSGNNLNILEHQTTLLQTVYLPNDGTAVAIDPHTGNIAVAHGHEIIVLKAVRTFTKPLTYVQDRVIQEDSPINCICWGFDEILCATDNGLSLWSTKETTRAWHESLPVPVNQCCFGPNAEVFCSFAKDDKLLKVWTRSSFDVQSVSFDFDYLYHPAAIRWICWRRLTDDSEANVLYTYARDHVLRIWSPTNTGKMGLWASIFCGDDSAPAIIDSGMLKSYQLLPPLTDVILLFHSDTTFSVITVSNIGIKNASKLATEKLLVDRLPLKLANKLSIDFDLDSQDRVWANVHSSRPDSFQLISHTRAGLILIVAKLTDILNPVITDGSARIFTLQSVLTGHEKSIQNIVRSGEGNKLLTQSRKTENVVWNVVPLSGETTLIKHSTIDTGKRGEVLWADIYSDWVVTLVCDELVLWDSSPIDSVAMSSVPISNTLDVLCLFLLPSGSTFIIFCVFPQSIKAWRMDSAGKNLEPLKIQALDALKGSKIHSAALIDPVGIREEISEDKSRATQDILLTYSDTGIIQSWSACSDKGVIFWTETSFFDVKENTGTTEIFKMQQSSTRKLAIAEETRLLIWDARNGVVEMDKNVRDSSEQQVSDLDWTITPGGEALLGVGFTSSVTIYCQQRYDYSKHLDVWAAIRSIDISKYTTHVIGDSHWLKDGTFVIGAGNQLFIQDAQVNMKDEATRELLQPRNTISALETAENIFDISAIINGPLPLYHPQFLIQLVYYDRLDLSGKILAKLARELRYSTIVEPQMVYDIESTLGFSPLGLMQGLEDDETESIASGIDYKEFSPKVGEDLQAALARASLPYLTRHQQITLLSVIQALVQLLENSASIDKSGFKYLLGYLLYRLHADSQESMNMRDFVWACFSQSKTVLFNIVMGDKAPNWKRYRAHGVPFWLEPEALRTATEDLAKSIFATTRDPVKASIFYMALKKKQVLIGLWRISTSHPEQQKVMKLLNRDFDDPRWKEAALKNAYALMSKRRYEYAASFFLLGGAVKDACSILVRQLGDLAMAVLVARVYDGDNGEAMRHLINYALSPDSVNVDVTFDRWAAAWGYLTVGDVQAAGESVVMSAKGKAKNWIDDPVLVKLYELFRPRFSLGIKEESRFILHVSSIYSRMGCEILALDLVSRWEFMAERNSIEPSQKTEPQSEGPVAAEVDTEQKTENATDAATDGPSNGLDPSLAAKLKAPPKDMMMEPDMSAFDFGF